MSSELQARSTNGRNRWRTKSVEQSFIVAAITCGLAALCYAEFASTLPVAGSAYTFSYATFGALRPQPLAPGPSAGR
jgi:hypothetical protein